MKATNEILTVEIYSREEDGTVLVECPHCHWIIGLNRRGFKGEQYVHNANQNCGGMFEVSYDAKFRKVLPVERDESATPAPLEQSS